jgi:hypothetical protein
MVVLLLVKGCEEVEECFVKYGERREATTRTKTTNTVIRTYCCDDRDQSCDMLRLDRKCGD